MSKIDFQITKLIFNAKNAKFRVLFFIFYKLAFDYLWNNVINV